MEAVECSVQVYISGWTEIRAGTYLAYSRHWPGICPVHFQGLWSPGMLSAGHTAVSSLFSAVSLCVSVEGAGIGDNLAYLRKWFHCKRPGSSAGSLRKLSTFVRVIFTGPCPWVAGAFCLQTDQKPVLKLTEDFCGGWISIANKHTLTIISLWRHWFLWLLGNKEPCGKRQLNPYLLP